MNRYIIAAILKHTNTLFQALETAETATSVEHIPPQIIDIWSLVYVSQV